MPVELHDQQLSQLENRFLEISDDRDEIPKSEENTKNKRVLPVKALNEVCNTMLLANCLSKYLLIVGIYRRSPLCAGIVLRTCSGWK